MTKQRYGPFSPATFVAMLVVIYPFVPFTTGMLTGVIRAQPAPNISASFLAAARAGSVVLIALELILAYLAARGICRWIDRDWVPLKFQVHLSTAVVLSLAAGLVMFLAARRPLTYYDSKSDFAYIFKLGILYTKLLFPSLALLVGAAMVSEALTGGTAAARSSEGTNEDSQPDKLTAEDPPTFPSSIERWIGAIPLALLTLLSLLMPVLAEPSLSVFKSMMLEVPRPAQWVFTYGVDQQQLVLAVLLATTGIYLMWICHDRRRIHAFNLMILALLFASLFCFLFTLVAPFLPYSGNSPLRHK